MKSGDFNRFFDEKGNIDVIFDLSSSLNSNPRFNRVLSLIILPIVPSFVGFVDVKFRKCLRNSESILKSF